jgi:uncharacterized cupin superfamily protein
MPDEPRAVLSASEIEQLEERSFQHPLNARSKIHMRSLSEQAGMEQMGVHIGRIPPGRESFAYHTHHYEEEFLYILSGRGIAEVDDEEIEIGAGDFLGFSVRQRAGERGSVAHHLRNPYDEDLVYLMGGERRPFEIADFPRLRKRLIRDRRRAWFVDISDLDEFDLSEVED